ncbi:hypothetical protein B5J94_04540 [Moraxella lacunata]|uniref:Uncharacterized protein n=1 Tax=Moraxella lacunata TaxID=477 RepID=A0A1V4GZK3_MORLA|nr:hypothetical protein B5J94_04540 [Moraxella lacunata]
MDFYKTKPQITNKTRSKTLRNRPILRFKPKKVQRHHPTKTSPLKRKINAIFKIWIFSLRNQRIFLIFLKKFHPPDFFGGGLVQDTL